jgi:hypothetical protein
MDHQNHNFKDDIELDTYLHLSRQSHPSSFLFNLSEELGLIGSKYDKYHNHLSCVSANLILLFLNRRGEYVYYSLDNNFYKEILRYNPLSISVRKIRKITDLLIENKFISNIKGRQNPKNKELCYRSRMKPTVKFLNLMRNNHIKREHLFKIDSEVIRLKNSEKNLKDYIDNDYTDKVRKDCQSYNSQLSRTKISLAKNKTVDEYLKTNSINYKNKNYYRVFNQKLNLGGRFYGPWWLNIPSRLRQFININNNKTAEFDYSSLIIHQIYSEEGLNYFEENTYSADPYLLRGVPDTERKVNKAIIQVALNCKNFENLNKELLSMYKEGKLTGRKPSKKEVERRLNMFKEMNPKISKYIYSKCALRFQFQDSEIARKIINRCSSHLIPVLSIHDSFIVEKTNSNFIIDTMNSAIKDTGLTSIPLIK